MTIRPYLEIWLNRFREVSDTDTCHICGKNIYRSTSYIRDALGRFSCIEHGNRTCYVCFGVCDSKSIDIPDYGLICSKCQKKKISCKVAGEIADLVGKFLKESGFDKFPGYRLHLSSAREMVESNEGMSALGLAYDHRNGTYSIKILVHLTKVRFAGTLAHELLHLWQYAHNIDAPGPISEGFCNLGEYQLLARLAKDESYPCMSTMLQNSDLIYGEGFRTMKVLHDVVGWKGVIQLMETFINQ